MRAADVSSLRMLRRAGDRIDRDYAEEIAIPALAASAGYSREHFIRAFRAAYGETPGRYRTGPGGLRVGRMITGMHYVTVWVLDADSAKEFYTEKLGFKATNDIVLDNGMRWLTVQMPGGDQELLLLDPMHSMLDDETAQQVRTLVAKGALSPGVMATSDCKGDHAALAGRGVEFIAEPAMRPYGIEALLRDDSGNWYSFTQRAGP